MEQLAIKGHATRGSEVIELLEMLGGKNDNYCIGNLDNYVYLINEYGYIEQLEDTLANPYTYHCFTLKEFKEKFPIKVGDKVSVKGIECQCKIVDMAWNSGEIEYLVYTQVPEGRNPEEASKTPVWLTVDDLSKCEDMSIPDNMKAITDCALQLVNNDAKYFAIKQKLSDNSVIHFNNCNLDKVELDLGEDWELKVEGGKTYVAKKKQELPKNYEECCKIFSLKPERATFSKSGLEYMRFIVVDFQRLLICRDAYWRLAGDWKPDYSIKGKDITKYVIRNWNDEIELHTAYCGGAFLSFPTKEMRDTFYKNFKDLIEECKELL